MRCSLVLWASLAGLLAASPILAQPAPRPVAITVEGQGADLRLSTRGLPALTGDGRSVAVPVVAARASGAANLVVQLLDARKGLVQRRLAVLTPSAAEHALRGPPAPTFGGGVRARAEAAQRMLEARHAAPLPDGAEATVDHDQATSETRLSTLVVRSRAGRIEVQPLVARSTPLLRRVLPSPPVRQACRRANRPVVSAAYRLPGNRLLVRVTFTGTDRCWAPAPVWRIYAVQPVP